MHQPGYWLSFTAWNKIQIIFYTLTQFPCMWQWLIFTPSVCQGEMFLPGLTSSWSERRRITEFSLCSVKNMTSFLQPWAEVCQSSSHYSAFYLYMTHFEKPDGMVDGPYKRWHVETESHLCDHSCKAVMCHMTHTGLLILSSFIFILMGKVAMSNMDRWNNSRK